MTFIKKNLPFILLNIAVSAVTVLAVLFLWDHFQQKRLAQEPVTPPEQSQVTQSEATAVPTTKPSTAQKTPVGDVAVSITLVSGLGDLKLEYILIKNDSANKLSLLDWSLRGDGKNDTPIKSDIMLNPGGTLKIFTKEGDNSALAIYLNREQSLWKSGVVVTLLDPEQTERASYTIP